MNPEQHKKNLRLAIVLATAAAAFALGFFVKFAYFGA